MTDPSASKIEAEVKFSDGINSNPFHCLSFSLSMMSKISGSTVFKSSLQAFGHVMPGFSFAYASAFVEYVLVVAAVIDARCFHSLKKESNKRILKCQFVRKTNTASSHKEKREAKADDGSDECDWKRRHHGHKECQEICNPKRKKKRAPNSLVFAQYRSTLCALLFVTRLQSLLFSSSSSSVVVARFFE